LVKCSDVFDAMLRTDMKEKNTGVIVLSEDSEMLDFLLRLIYNQEVKGSLKDIIDLVLVTRKYLMTAAQKACLEKLEKALSSDNAVEIWIHASNNNFDVLKGKTLDFITKYVIDNII
jgi:hypothetical protein